MKKLQAIAESRNFGVTLLSIVFLAFSYNGIEINPDQAAQTLWDALAGGDLALLFPVLLTNVINPILSFVKNGFSFGFIKTLNFWTQAATFVILLLTGYGFVFPQGAAADVVNTIFGGNLTAIIVALLINVVNPVWQWLSTFVFNKDKDPAEVVLLRSKAA